MNDDEMRRAYAAYRSQPGPDAGRERPSLEDLQRLAAGDVPAGEREALLDRALADPASAGELAMLHAVSGPRRKPIRIMRATWVVAAAAAVLLVVAIPVLRAPRPDAEDGAVFRSARTGDPAMSIVSPADGSPLQAGTVLVWRARADAESYVVEVMSDAGDAVTTIATRDTMLVVPDSVSASRLGRASGWMVIARLRNGGQRQSVVRLTAPRTK